MDEHGQMPGGEGDMQGGAPSQNLLKDDHVKHVAMLIVALVVLLSLAGALWFYSGGGEEQVIQDVPEEVVVDSPKKVKTCEEYVSPEEVYKEAIEGLDEYACRCIEDEGFKTTCLTTVKDNRLLQNAINNFDARLCEQISIETLAQRCGEMVASSVEYFENEDPEHLAKVRVLSRSEDAIESYEAIVAENPESSKALATLALLYAEKGLIVQGEGGDQMPYVEKAFEVIEKAKEIDPDVSEIVRIEAYIYEVLPDLEKAMTLYTKAIEMDPQNILAYAGRGHAGKMRGMLDNALEDYRKAAELDVEKQYLNIYTSLCNLEISLGNSEDAEKYCLVAAEDEEGDVQFRSEALQMLAAFALERQDPALANSHLSKAETLTPNDPNLYEEWSRVKIYQGEYDVSEEYARKAVDIAPGKASARLALSHALYMQERYEESIQTALEGAELVESDPSLLGPVKNSVLGGLYYSVANNYREMGDTENQEKYIAMAEALQEALQEEVPSN